MDNDIMDPSKGHCGCKMGHLPIMLWCGNGYSNISKSCCGTGSYALNGHLDPHIAVPPFIAVLQQRITDEL